MARTKHHGDKAKQRAFGENWNWLENEPRWWRKLMKHRPQRRREREALRQALHGGSPDFPHDKKPREWYW